MLVISTHWLIIIIIIALALLATLSKVPETKTTILFKHAWFQPIGCVLCFINLFNTPLVEA